MCIDVGGVTKELRKRAARAAQVAYETDCYGHGSHDWQDAEVAACSVLQEAGMTNDDAYEAGREIAAVVVREIDDAPEVAEST